MHGCNRWRKPKHYRPDELPETGLPARYRAIDGEHRVPVAAERRLGDDGTLPAPASNASNEIRTTSRRIASIVLDVMS